MTDAEMQRLGQIVADEVCQRASDEIKLICLRFLCVVIVFWIVKMAIAFWKFWSIDEERSASYGTFVSVTSLELHCYAYA